MCKNQGVRSFCSGCIFQRTQLIDVERGGLSPRGSLLFVYTNRYFETDPREGESGYWGHGVGEREVLDPNIEQSGRTRDQDESRYGAVRLTTLNPFHFPEKVNFPPEMRLRL